MIAPNDLGSYSSDGVPDRAAKPDIVLVAGPFPLGQLVSTPGALTKVHPEDLAKCLQRHCRCDWGDLCPEDRAENDRALLHSGRLFSAYVDRTGVRFWIITECDRSATTVLLPEEY